jgi:glyoxylase-like metal-dependent hydrolase (beta-lactamase superfamily II)
VVETLEREGVLLTFSDGDEPAPGLRVESAPGHRVGHAAIHVDGPNPILNLADSLHHLAHVRNPEWDREADSEPDLALATRRRLMADCATSGRRVVAAHIPGPGSYRIVAGEDGVLAPVRVEVEN